YRDLDGNPIRRSGTGLDHFMGVGASLSPGPEPDTELSWAERVCAFADGGTPAVFWYFVSDGQADGAGHFVGYDSGSKACVGYLGTGGFRDTPLEPGERIPFPGRASGVGPRVLCRQVSDARHPHKDAAGQAPRGSPSGWDVYVHSSDAKLYHADLRRRTVRV